MNQKNIDNFKRFGHPADNHTVGVVPDLRMSDMGKERGFLVCGLWSELPGYREVLGAPTGVITTRALFIARNNQNVGGNTMSSRKNSVVCAQLKSAVNQQIEDTQAAAQNVTKTYHRAVTVAYTAFSILNGMYAEINKLVEELNKLTATREGGQPKVLPFAKPAEKELKS